MIQIEFELSEVSASASKGCIYNNGLCCRGMSSRLVKLVN